MAIVTISRECKSGSSEIGQAVAKELSYEFLDKKRIFSEIKKYGEHWAKLDKELDETSPDIWERYDLGYHGLIALIESIIFQYARKDNCVIIGRGGNYLLRDIPFVLKVRIIAPLEIRIARMMEKEHIDRRTAEESIKEVDKKRAGYIEANYGRDWEDIKSYDMVFNTGDKTFTETTEIVVAALKKYDQHKTPEALDLLSGRADAALLKAIIAIDTRLTVPTLDVVYDGKRVVIRGTVHNPKERHLIEEIIDKAPITRPIKNEMHYRG